MRIVPRGMFITLPLLVAVLIIAIAAAMGTAVAGPPPPGAWNVLAPVPATGTGVEGMQVGVIGDKIIAANGYDNGSGDTHTTRLYDIDTDSWSTGATSSAPARSEGTAVTHGGDFYAIGGRSGSVLSNLDRYTLATNTWTSLAPMPTARAGLAAAVVGDAIYVIGGRNATGGPCSQSAGGELSTVERFDIDSGTWSTAASLPSARSDLAAYAFGGKIFVFGGCRRNADFSISFLSDVDVYNPVTNTWSTAPADLPTARAGLYAVGAVGNQVYIIGGWAGGPPLGVNEAYNVTANTYTTNAPMLTPRGEMGVASRGGRVYTVGGSLPAFGASSNANEVFKPRP